MRWSNKVGASFGGTLRMWLQREALVRIAIERLLPSRTILFLQIKEMYHEQCHGLLAIMQDHSLPQFTCYNAGTYNYRIADSDFHKELLGTISFHHTIVVVYYFVNENIN